MDDLLNYQCIDFKKLLILKAKSLKITDDECYLLLIIMTMLDIQMKPITPSQIQKLCCLQINKIDEILLNLVDKHYIKRNRGILDLKPLYQYLLQQERTQEKEVDLISLFENVFGRGLNQMELEIISGFKRQGFDDEMIIDALNESVKSGVKNFRYIEKILDNWSKYGVKKRFAPTQSSNKTEQEFSQEVKNYDWWSQDE